MNSPQRNRRLLVHRVIGGLLVLGSLSLPALSGAQTVTVRWGESLAPNHPQVMMAERVAREVREKTGGRVDIQVFPNSQLGSGKEMVEMVASGGLQMVTEGAGALAAFLPSMSLIEAPYLWRDAAHLAKLAGTTYFARLNEDLVAKRGMRMVGVTYYGKRHLTSGSKPVRTPADMAGFKLRVPPVDVFSAMAESWGARATPVAFGELYLSLSMNLVDGQENPLPTIQSAKLNEVQKHLILTGHIITPRVVVANEAFLKALSPADRAILNAALASAVAWQDKELQSQESMLINTLKTQGMNVIEPDISAWSKPVLESVPKKFEGRWGKGMFEALRAL